MHFPGIRLVEQTKQKFRRYESVFFKKTSDCNSRALLLITAPTKNKALANLKYLALFEPEAGQRLGDSSLNPKWTIGKEKLMRILNGCEKWPNMSKFLRFFRKKNVIWISFHFLTIVRGNSSSVGLTTGSGLCAETSHASCLWLLFSMFQNMLGPLWPNVDTSGIKGPQTKTGKTENLHSFFLFLVQFPEFRRHHVNIPWKGAECYAISSENLFQEFSLPYNQLVRLEFAETECTEFLTVVKLGLRG